MTKKQKDVLWILGTLLLVAAGLAATEDRQLAVFGLALIPLFFACWGLSYLLAGSRNREIAKNLTEQERETLEDMTGDFGRNVGLFFGCPTAVLCGLLYYLTNKSWLVAFVTFVVCVLVWIPFGWKKRGEINNFLWQTRWAKQNPNSAM